MEKRQSDLFAEGFGLASPPGAADSTEEERDGFRIRTAVPGRERYRTVLCGKIWLGEAEKRRRLAEVLAGLLREELLRETGLFPERILVCGIGNPAVPADALGPRTLSRLYIPGETVRPAVFGLRPGLPAASGFDTARHVYAVADMLRADRVVLIDSLAARARERLQTVIQITTAGLHPGSALGHSSGEISGRTMPCPVLAVGIPCVINASALCDTCTGDEEPLFVTRAESDLITDCCASLLGRALQTAFFGK